MPDGQVVIQITGDDSLLTADIKNLGRTVESQLGSMQGSFSKAGNALTLAVTAPALAAGGAAFKLASNFETTMNMIAQATGAPAAEMAKLDELAKQMGADTIYSAGEAADAMLELAKSGLTPAQIAAGALDASLQLAAAGDLALADAATVTANAINTFNLEADDAASVANALAGGANASSASVQSLQQALAQVGPGATNAGLSLQETVGVLAAFADNGIQGSDAGTSLKTMLARLVPQTDEAAAAMKKLGLEFVNADGSFKSIDEIAQQLQDSLGGLSEAERAQALTTMFGSDATRAATVLMNEGAEGLAKYTQATNDQTAASGMAEARMSGSAGAIEQMTGSVETAALAVGESLAPVIVDLAGKVKELADWFAGLDEQQQQQIVQWVAIAAAAGPALKVMSGGIGVIRTLNAVAGSKAMGDLAAGIRLVGANATSSVGSLTAMGGAATAATAGYVALAGAIGFAIGEMINSIPAVQEWQQAISDAALAGEDVGSWTEPITWAMGQVAKFGVESGGEVAAFSDQAAKKFRALGIEIDENNQLTERGARQMDAYIARQRSSGDAAVDAANKYAQYADEIAAVTDAQYASESADIALERAKIRLLEAQEREKKILEEFPASSREAQEAALDVRDAENQLEGAARRATTEQAKLNEAMRAIPRPASPDGWVAYYTAIGDAAGIAAAKANAANTSLVGGRAKAGTGGYQIPLSASGRVATSPMVSWLAENGYPEYVVTTEPVYRPRSLDLYDQLGHALGVSSAQSITVAPGAIVVYPHEGVSAQEVASIVDQRFDATVRSALSRRG